MTLQEVLEAHQETVPDAVAIVARGDEIEFASVGNTGRESVFEIASVTKPIVAAAALLLVHEHRVHLDDPIAKWLPELADPVVVRTPASPVDDVVPATRAITVRDLLTFHSGWGFSADFSLPATVKLFEEAHLHGRPDLPGPDRWLQQLSEVPLLHQPGEGWLYNTASDVLGVLIHRETGSLPDFLGERFYVPLGMTGTSFISPVLPSGAGGLKSTVDDLLAFYRHLMGSDLLPHMAIDYTTAEEREAAHIFLEGQGWGFGGSVDVAAIDPWHVPGRFGWIGGSGTAAHIVPGGTVTVLLTRTAMTGPSPTPVMRDFWRYAASS